ncbi:HTH-type transcriptional regulator DmlR [compost metagenome]
MRVPVVYREVWNTKKVSDLQTHNCIFIRQKESPYGMWSFNNSGRMESIKVRGVLSCNDGEAALNWALAGYGLLLRAEWDIARYVRSGRLRLLMEGHIQTPADVYAVHPQQLHLSARVRSLIDFLTDRFKQLDSIKM